MILAERHIGRNDAEPRKSSRGAVLICCGVIVLACAFGVLVLIKDALELVTESAASEDFRRLAAWGEIYGLADKCVSAIPSDSRILLVDPTDHGYGGAIYGVSGDIDAFDLNPLAFVVYPRTVTGVAEIPRTWDASSLGVKRIAVWRDPRWRSRQATAVASGAEASLAADPNWRITCSFEGAHGEHGALFAPVPDGDAPQHIQTDAASPPAIQSFSRAAAALCVMWGIGFLLLSIASERLSRPLKLSLALPLGAIAVPLELLIFSVVHLTWSPVALTVPWLVVAVVLLARSLRTLGTGARSAEYCDSVRLSVLDRCAIAILLVSGMALAAVAPLGIPWSDGFHFYYFRAHAFVFDGNALDYYRRAATLGFTVPAHPPLVPLDVSWMYVFLGREDVHWSLLLWPSLFLSLLGGFYALARIRFSRSGALWSTVILLFGGFQLTEAALRASYADLPLATFLLFGTGLMWLALQRREGLEHLAFLSGVCLGGGALTKEEGMVAAVIAIVTFAALTLSHLGRSRALRVVALSIAGLTIELIPVLGLRVLFPIRETTVHLGWRLSVSQLLTRIVTATIGFAARGIPGWLPILALGATWVLLSWRARRWEITDAGLFLIVVVLGQLGTDIFVNALNATEYQTALPHDATRLLLQLLAISYLSALDVWPVLVAIFYQLQERYSGCGTETRKADQIVVT